MKPFRMMAFDPGTTSFGAAVLDVDLNDNYTFNVVDGVTFNGAPGVKVYMDTANSIDECEARLRYIYPQLLAYMREYHPDHLSTERPFTYKNPGTFAKLVSAVNLIIRAATEYDPQLVLTQLSPQEAKKFFNANGPDSKERVKQALIASPSISLPARSMSEHVYDAISVGVCGTYKLMGKY